MIRDMLALMSYTVTDRLCRKAHINQKRNMGLTQVMHPDLFDTGRLAPTHHFPVKAVFRELEDPVTFPDVIEHLQAIFHPLTKEVRHGNHAVAFRRFRRCNHIPLLQTLI